MPKFADRIGRAAEAPATGAAAGAGPIRLAGAVGAALGLLAFGADYVPGVAGRVVVELTSSGFAWGLAAFLVGRSRPSRRAAMSAACVTLVVATALYYLLVVLVSRRWSGGYLQDGSSADLLGLRSVALATAAWLAGSVLAGPLLGALGHAVRTAPTWPAALAAGTTCGLLSGEAWHLATSTPPWLPSGVANPFSHGVAPAELVGMVLPIAVLIGLTVVHRLARAWPALLASFVCATAAATLAWRLTETIRHGG